MIIINRSKAEDVVLGRLRAERGPRLADLDVQYVRALEQGVDTSAIVAEKQALRDVTLKDLSVLSIDQLASLTLDDSLAL